MRECRLVCTIGFLLGAGYDRSHPAPSFQHRKAFVTLATETPLPNSTTPVSVALSRKAGQRPSRRPGCFEMKRKPANTNRAQGPASAATDGKPSIARMQTTSQPARNMPPVTPQKIRTAWIRLGKTIQEFCRQPSRKCTLCLVSEDKIVFRSSSDPAHCELKLKGNVIVRQFGGVCDYFEIVLIKGHGIAYEVSGRRVSATRLSLKLVNEQQYGREPETPHRAKPERNDPVPSIQKPKRGPQHIFSPEEILWVLAEAAMRPVNQVLTEEGIRRATYEQWREKLSGLRIDQVQHVLNLENENARLAAIVRTLRLDKRMLQEVLSERTRSSTVNKRQPRCEGNTKRGMVIDDAVSLVAGGSLEPPAFGEPTPDLGVKFQQVVHSI